MVFLRLLRAVLFLGYFGHFFSQVARRACFSPQVPQVFPSHEKLTFHDWGGFDLYSPKLGSWLDKTCKVIVISTLCFPIFFFNSFDNRDVLIFYVTIFQCSVTCEKGHKQRIVRCVNINNQRVNERLCRQSPKPPVTVSCFTGSCKTEWFTSHKWSKVGPGNRPKT